nr:unnamed protein product [Callosobruchus analis]
MDAALSSIPLSREIVPWWNNDVAEAIRAKKREFNAFRRHPNMENLIKFKRARAKARRLMLESQRRSWKEYVTSITASTSPSEVWNKVSTIRGTRSYRNINSIRGADGSIITEPAAITEAFADHFSSISSSSNYAPEFQVRRLTSESALDFDDENQLSYNIPFQLHELESVLRYMKKSAAGPDKINFEMLSHLPTNLKNALLNVYNNIWITGIYPRVWKEALIVPVLKDGKSPLIMSNYRPISLTCCLGKVMEKMVNERLSWVLEQGHFLTEHQSGFRKDKSTLDQLVYIENHIQEGFLKRKHTVAIFFDIVKAYDMTWRQGILVQLYEWGLRGNLPKFISSFLEERHFRVKRHLEEQQQHGPWVPTPEQQAQYAQIEAANEKSKAAQILHYANDNIGVDTYSYA